MSDQDSKKTTNELKSEGVKKRWNKKAEEDTNTIGDRKSKRYEFKCFEGLKLSMLQKEFVVTYMDSPFFGRRENRYLAFKKVFNPSTEGSLKANCSTLLSKAKIKEAMRAYQIHSLQSHKLEVTTESIENFGVFGQHVLISNDGYVRYDISNFETVTTEGSVKFRVRPNFNNDGGYQEFTTITNPTISGDTWYGFQLSVA